jgi:hypothetical protein
MQITTIGIDLASAEPLDADVLHAGLYRFEGRSLQDSHALAQGLGTTWHAEPRHSTEQHDARRPIPEAAARQDPASSDQHNTIPMFRPVPASG